jgi:hypothetical protein
MAIAKLLSIGFLLALASCESKPAAKNEALAFFQAKKYAYVTRVSAIPAAALNRIAEAEGDTLRICDVESGLSINLTDVHLSEKECTSKLNFALVGDSACLISYVQGGIGQSDEVRYLTYKGTLRHESYSAMGKVENVAQLDSFLQKQISVSRPPKLAEEDDYTMLTPPPPWPKKPSKTERP